MARKPFVLFVCSRNSARSQMAEGLLRHLAGDSVEVGSAGVEPGTLSPFAVQALAERGIDISAQRAKSIREYLGRVLVDHLIIVCDAAAQSCPAVWPNMRERHNWPFPDPAAVDGTDAQKLAAFREVRDALESHLTTWLASKPTGIPPRTE